MGVTASSARGRVLRPRIGAHVTGGISGAPDRARALGCECLQIFSSSPRQWHAPTLTERQVEKFIRQCREAELRPVVIHANYLINMAGANPEFLQRSMAALRGELERARALRADYLVLHPGSGDLRSCIDSLKFTLKGFAWEGLTLLLENTAGGGSHLAGNFGQLAELLDAFPGLPLAACIDSCHAWVAGYDLLSPDGYEAMIKELDATVGLARVPVWHANDAKAGRGSHHDRHEHIGKGQLGETVFARLLQDRRLRNAAFLLETPVDTPQDQPADLAALRRLRGAAPAAARVRRTVN